MSLHRDAGKGQAPRAGEDYIYRDSRENQHAGAVSAGFGPDQRAHPAQSHAGTKAKARDKPREPHR